METFAWTILIVSLLGIIFLLLSKLPKLLVRPTHKVRLAVAADSFLAYFGYKIKQFGRWLWHFVLEAKDIRPSKIISSEVDKVKKVFKIRIRESEKDPVWMPEISEHNITPTHTEEVKGSEPKTAEDLYLETLRRDPDNKKSYEGLGRLYLQEKNYSEAVEIFRYLTKAEPMRDVYWSNLGISLYSVKDFQGAVAAYDQALKLNSKVPVRWINLALCFEAIDEHMRAVKAINKALELDPRNINYLMLLCDVYLRVNNKIRAEEVLVQILSFEPTNNLAREKLMRIRI